MITFIKNKNFTLNDVANHSHGVDFLQQYLPNRQIVIFDMLKSKNREGQHKLDPQLSADQML